MKCKNFGKVRNKQGKLVDSRLYKGLLSIAPKNVATTAYKRVLSDKFQDEILPNLPKDEFGQPLLSVIVKMSKELQNSVNLDKLSTAIENELQLKNTHDSTTISVKKELFDKINPFPEKLVFEINRNPKIGFTASIVGKNYQSPTQSEFITTLKSILEKAGFSIGSINEFENRIGAIGVFDSEALAKGLKEVIRVANTQEGIDSIPEEFAHLVISSLYDTPQVQRLLSYLNTPGVLEVILGSKYDLYKARYKNQDKLIKEVAGKLLAKSLEEAYDNKKITTTLERLINLVKRVANKLFSRINTSDINKALQVSKGITDGIAIDVLNNKVTDTLARRITKNEGSFYELSDKAEALLNVYKDILKRVSVKLKTMEAKGNTEGIVRQRTLKGQLEAAYNSNNINIGILSYVNDITQHSGYLLKELKKLEDENIENRAKRLDSAYSYTQSYIASLSDLERSLAYFDHKYEDDHKEIIDLIRTTKQELQIINTDLQELIKKEVESYLVALSGSDVITITTGVRKGSYTIGELLRELPQDIGQAELWLNSISEGSDIITKLADYGIRLEIGKAYDETLEYSKKIQAMHEEYRKESGTNNTSFMLEKKNGKVTGRYIKKYDTASYNNDFIVAVQHSKDPDYTRKNWKKEHPITEYYTSEYEVLNEAERKYYDSFMSIYEELQKKYKLRGRDLYRAIPVRKNFIQRVFGSKSFSDIKKAIKEGALDQVVRRVDDNESAFSKGYVDIEGELLKTIPMAYIASLEDPEALSDDCTSALIVFSSAATRYEHLKQLEDIINLQDVVMQNRKFKVTKKDKPIKVNHESNIPNIELSEELVKNGIESNAYKQWRHIVDSQIYGETSNKNDVSQSTGVSGMKVAGLINKISVVSSMGFNLALGVANLGTGLIFSNTEAFAGKYFTKKQLLKADKDFFADILNIFADLPRKIKTSKISLFNELMDIENQSLTAFMSQEEGKSMLHRLASMKTIMMFNRAGDFFIRTRTAMAMANNFKLYDSEGNETNLWDSLVEEYIDEANPDKGKRLVLKDNLFYEDGTSFTRNDIQKFRNKITRINQKIIGTTNPQDLNIAKTTVVGKLAFLYRNWMVPSFNRRWQASNYDVLMGEETEGYYRTAFRVLGNIMSELRAGNIANIISDTSKTLTDTEKANLKRAITEVVQYALLIIGYNTLSGAWDDEDKSWIQNFVLYELRRLQTEVGVLTPGPQIITEANNILKSPIPSTRTIEKTTNLLKLIYPSSYMTEIESGRYEGHTRAYKYLMESPIGLCTNTIMRQMYPEEMLKWYELGK